METSGWRLFRGTKPLGKALQDLGNHVADCVSRAVAQGRGAFGKSANRCGKPLNIHPQRGKLDYRCAVGRSGAGDGVADTGVQRGQVGKCRIQTCRPLGHLVAKVGPDYSGSRPSGIGSKILGAPKQKPEAEDQKHGKQKRRIHKGKGHLAKLGEEAALRHGSLLRR
jgi:hypothetical protein